MTKFNCFGSYLVGPWLGGAPITPATMGSHVDYRRLLATIAADAHQYDVGRYC